MYNHDEIIRNMLEKNNEYNFTVIDGKANVGSAMLIKLIHAQTDLIGLLMEKQRVNTNNIIIIYILIFFMFVMLCFNYSHNVGYQQVCDKPIVNENMKD